MQSGRKKSRPVTGLPLTAYIWGIWVVTIGLAARGLFSRFIHDAHDTTPYLWAKALFEMWQRGQLWPQWLPQVWFGYGAPVFHYYAPLYYWVTAVWQVMGIDPIVATKITLIASLALGAVGIYRLARLWFGVPEALLASGIMIWMPYYLSLLYQRAAFPEFFALNLVPWLLWAVVRLYQSPDKWKWLQVVVWWTLIFFSHTLTSGLTVALVAALAIFLYLEDRNKQKLVWLASGLGVTLLLSAAYWLPAVGDKSLINYWHLITGKFQYQDHFSDFTKLINLYRNREFGWLSIGIVPLLVWLAGLAAYWLSADKKKARLLGFSLLIAGGLVFMALPVSIWTWKLIPWLAYYQFPTRFLAPATIFFGLIGAWLISELRTAKAQVVPAAIGLMLLVMLANFPLSYTRTNQYENGVIGKYLNINEYIGKKFFDSYAKAVNGVTELAVDSGSIPIEYLPYGGRRTDDDMAKLFDNGIASAESRLSSDGIVQPMEIFQALPGDAEKVNVRVTTNRPSYFAGVASSTEPFTLQINMLRFPAFWPVKVDGQLAKTYAKDDQLAYYLDLPAGNHQIEIKWQNTPLTVAGRWISWVALLLVIIWLAIGRKAKKPVKTHRKRAVRPKR